MFSIEAHPTIPAALRIRSWSVWDLPTALAFERGVTAAIRALPCRRGEHLVFNDVRDFCAQSEEVVRVCRGLFDRGEEGRGLALLVGSGSARAQLPRVAGDSPVGVFEDREAAEIWLRARRAG